MFPYVNMTIEIMNSTMIEYNEGYHTYYVYIITNKYRSTFYIGVTNNLGLRLQQHKENIENNIKTFASKYNLQFLVYYEIAINNKFAQANTND